MKVSFIILAGGKSERMGRDKRYIKYKGKYFIEHAVRLAEKISDDVIISVDRKENFGKFRVVEDIINVRAPIIGLFSSMKHCKYEYTCVIPCDVPLARSGVFRYLIKKARGVDGAVPRNGKYIEPLIAVYKVKSMLLACKNAIAMGEYRLYKVIRNLNINFVEFDELKRFDPDLSTFRNINTPKDLEELESEG